MNAVIGDILPLALAVAISPIPIIATILMLMSPKPRPLGLSFLGGWVVGIGVAVVAFTLLGGILPEPETGGSRPVVGTIQLIVGALLLLMAVKQWRGRPGPGEDAELPKWMAAIDTMKPGAALGLALLLSAVNPKNLLLAVAAGASIGRAQLGTGRRCPRRGAGVAGGEQRRHHGGAAAGHRHPTTRQGNRQLLSPAAGSPPAGPAPSTPRTVPMPSPPRSGCRTPGPLG